MTKNSPKRISLLVIEENHLMRVGLQDLIRRDSRIKFFGEAPDLTNAVAKAGRLKPNVVLLSMGTLSQRGGGIAACKELKKVSPETRIIILMNGTEREMVVAGLKAGAHGILQKEINPQTLIQSIKLVAAGHSVFDFSVIKHIRSKLQEPEGTTCQPNFRTLSSQEQRVMALVVEGKTNKEIGNILTLSEKTIRNYLYHIYKKLHIQRRTQAAVFFSKHKTNY